jgi:uncharacterized membrane protein
MVRRVGILLATGLLALFSVRLVQAEDVSVKAVLFYNPESEACKTLINEIFPPLILEYNETLLIIYIDVTNPAGGELYQSAVTSLNVPEDQRVVPLLVMEDTYLAGFGDIQEDFPRLIDQKIAQGGNNWPSVPGLEDALRKSGFSKTPSNAWEKFMSGQPANTLAVIVLIVLTLSLVFSILITFRPGPKFLDTIPEWVFPGLLVIGLVVASYLTYTELTQSEVFCGGISRCTEVHESQYSHILGLITVGEFGIIGYCLIGLAWIVHRTSRGTTKMIAAIAMFGFAVFGVSFSTYLTFLEPFVIGATCLWCLASAVIMSLILPLTTGPVRAMLPVPSGRSSGG